MGGFAYIWKTNQAATTILGAGGGTIDIVPQIVRLANATENAQCQVNKAGKTTPIIEPLERSLHSVRDTPTQRSITKSLQHSTLGVLYGKC